MKMILSIFLLLATSAWADEAKVAAPAAVTPSVIGDKATAGWDATTQESAVTDDQKKVLKKGKPTTMTGEIVDVSCYLQLGKKGEKHIDCGRKCILAGQPFGILDRGKHLVLIMPEEHHPRRDGQVSLRETFAELVGKTVTVSGMLSRLEGNDALFVKAAPYTPKKAQ